MHSWLQPSMPQACFKRTSERFLLQLNVDFPQHRYPSGHQASSGAALGILKVRCKAHAMLVPA